MSDMVYMEFQHFYKLDYPTQEAFNTLCTNLSFTGGDIKRIMVTSCHPHEGKSFVTINLMRSLVNTGMRVLLVDADIRASALQSTYGITIKTPDGTRYNGLSYYLSGRCDMSGIVGETNINEAYLILSGKNVVNSFPLYSTSRFKTLLDKLTPEFDVVLIDTPPIGAIIDAAKIAPLCDGALFVVQSGETTDEELKEGIEQIEKTNCPILGYVMNKYDESGYGGKYYYYKKKNQRERYWYSNSESYSRRNRK